MGVWLMNRKIVAFVFAAIIMFRPGRLLGRRGYKCLKQFFCNFLVLSIEFGLPVPLEKVAFIVLAFDS